MPIKSTFTADRDLSHLIPEMKQRVELFIAECEKRGFHVFVTEGLRTKARQRWLYSFGRWGENKRKGVLTWTLKSNHIKGEAVDIAFRGDVLYPSRIKTWERVFEIAEECGLESLYVKTGKDKPHLNFDHSWKPKKPSWQKELEDWASDQGIQDIQALLEGNPYSIIALIKRSVEKKHSSS